MILNIMSSRNLSLLAYAIKSVVEDNNLPKETLVKAVKEVAIPAIDKQFRTEGMGRWKPLAPVTVDKKGHARILDDKGKLHKSAVALSRWNITQNSAEFSIGNSPSPYGLVHEKGWANLDERNYAELEEDDIDMIADMFGLSVEQRLDEVL